MSLTPNLGLTKAPTTDNYDVSVVNANLDIVDDAIGDKNSLLTAIKSSLVAAINWLYARIVGMTTEPITYYVNASTGSNSNDGLTAGTPFLTMQYAVNKLPKYLAHDCTVNVATGTYAEDCSISGFVGNGTLIIQGDSVMSTTRTVQRILASYCKNFIYVMGFNGTKTGASAFDATGSTLVQFQFCQTSASDATYPGFSADLGSNVILSTYSVSNRANAIRALNNSNVRAYTGSGSGNTTVLLAQYGGKIAIRGTLPTGTTEMLTQYGGLIIPDEDNAGIIQKPTGTALPATTGTIAVTTDGKTKNITPTGACTFTTGEGISGDICVFRITTSGTTSYTLTWGSGFKANGTLATGTASGKIFMVAFMYTGGEWCEFSRTPAM